MNKESRSSYASTCKTLIQILSCKSTVFRLQNGFFQVFCCTTLCLLFLFAVQFFHLAGSIEIF